jgi:predicted DsbA family dithiol-disulfide isomerase
VVEKYMIVEIWSDVVCPWCAIGRARLDTALSQLEPPADVEVVLRSFELDPTAPVGAAEPMVEVLAARYGLTRDEAAGAMARTEDLAAAEGLEMHMETTLHCNTVDAHRLLHLALDAGGPDLQKSLNAALVDAHFRDGADVGDHAVLRKVAVEVGLDESRVDEVLAGDTYAEAVAADVRQARAYGATGVPFFVIDRKYGVSGAQPVEVFAQVLERASQSR